MISGKEAKVMWQRYCCPNCGYELNAGDRFCGNCGVNLTAVQLPQDRQRVNSAWGNRQISINNSRNNDILNRNNRISADNRANTVMLIRTEIIKLLSELLES